MNNKAEIKAIILSIAIIMFLVILTAVQMGELPFISSAKTYIEDTLTVGTEDLKVDYTISIDSFDSNVIKVQIEFENMGSSLDLREYAYGWNSNPLEKFIATDENGNILEVKELTSLTYALFSNSPPCKLWSIDSKGVDKIIVNYEKDTNCVSAERGNLALYMLDDEIFIEPETLLIAPTDFSKLISENCTLNFDVPEGYNVETLWDSEKGVYYPLRKSLSEIKPWSEEDYNLTTFFRTLFYIGKSKPYYLSIDGTEVTVILPTSFSEDKKTALVSDIEKIFSYLQNVLGQNYNGRYLMSISGTLFSPLQPAGQEYTYGQLAGNQVNINDSYGQIMHQYFHRFNGWGFEWAYNFDEFGQLWNEGINQYYDFKGVIVLYEDFSIKDNPGVRDELNRYYLEYKEFIESNELRYIDFDHGSSVNSDFILYFQGALISMALDFDIQKQTRGAYSLDDLVKIINSEYGNHAGTLTLNNLIATLKIMTGKDYTCFYNDYIAGCTPLPIDEYFLDKDGNGQKDYLDIIETGPSYFN